MAITKRPKAGESVAAVAEMDEIERDRRERAFLSGAPDVAKTAKPEDTKMQTVHLRFEPEMLPRIDAAAKELGLGSRAAWVRYAVMQTLKTQEK
jgi:hypothetical protein